MAGIVLKVLHIYAFRILKWVAIAHKIKVHCISMAYKAVLFRSQTIILSNVSALTLKQLTVTEHTMCFHPLMLCTIDPFKLGFLPHLICLRNSHPSFKP